MNSNDLKLWKQGDDIRSTSHLNEPIEWIKSRGDVSTGRAWSPEDWQVINQSNGTVISPSGFRMGQRCLYAQIVGSSNAGGPAGDFTDNRYWFTAKVMAATGNPTCFPVFRDDQSLYGLTKTQSPGSIEYVNTDMAINIAEQDKHTHNLPYGTYVFVQEVFEDGGAASDEDPKPILGVSRWVFYCPSIGRPQYQSQVYSGVAQNTPGWDFTRAHSILTP